MTTIADLDTEIRRLHQEASALERAPSSFDEAWPAVEAELDQAEATFRRLGPQLSGVVSQLPEHVHERRQAMVGLVMVTNKKAVIDSERARIKAQTEGGISATDKQRRLDQLRAAVLRASANRELLVRATEVEGEFAPRPGLHPELAVFRRADVERLAR
jgi:hypothetical protein